MNYDNILSCLIPFVKGLTEFTAFDKLNLKPKFRRKEEENGNTPSHSR